jgi:hypothetical protein
VKPAATFSGRLIYVDLCSGFRKIRVRPEITIKLINEKSRYLRAEGRVDGVVSN